MLENNNTLRQSKLEGKVLLIEDDPDHARYLEGSLRGIYSSLNINPEIIWFQYFYKVIEYLNSEEVDEESILSVWVDLYLGEYGDNKEPNELLTELYSILQNTTDKIFPISSLIDQSSSLDNFVKKEEVTVDNARLRENLREYVDEILSSRSVAKPDPSQSKDEFEDLKKIIYGYQLNPGVVDKLRLLDQKIDRLELDFNFQYMKLEKLLIEIKAATWLLWAVVKLSKKLSLSEKITSFVLSILFGGGFTYLVLRLLELLK